jgi:hypothetical protein
MSRERWEEPRLTAMRERVRWVQLSEQLEQDLADTVVRFVEAHPEADGPVVASTLLYLTARYVKASAAPQVPWGQYRDVAIQQFTKALEAVPRTPAP